MSVLSVDDCKILWKAGLTNFSPHDFLSLYINIPFCFEKCSFCIYYKYPFQNKAQVNKYLEDLEKEVAAISTVFRDHLINSIYVGGGTPSLLTADQIARLFRIISDHFNIADGDENFRCFEAHPVYLTEAKLNALMTGRMINRLSFGVQSLDKLVITANNRVWVSQNKLKRIQDWICQKAEGRKFNLNVDLMIGLKNESFSALLDSFCFFAEMQIPRIAIYCNRNMERTKGEEFRERAISWIQDLSMKVEMHFPDYFSLNADISKYQEAFAWALRKGYSDRLFRYYYDSGPIDYNNNIGIGYGATSHIINLNRYYWNAGDFYHLRPIAETEARMRNALIARGKEIPRINWFNF